MFRLELTFCNKYFRLKLRMNQNSQALQRKNAFSDTLEHSKFSKDFRII